MITKNAQDALSLFVAGDEMQKIAYQMLIDEGMDKEAIGALLKKMVTPKWKQVAKAGTGKPLVPGGRGIGRSGMATRSVTRPSAAFRGGAPSTATRGVTFGI